MFLDIRTEDRAGGETAFLEEGLGRGGSGKGRLTVGLPWSRGLCGCGGGRVQAGHCVQRGGGRCGVEGLSRAIGAGCGPGKGRVCESQACRRPAGRCPFHPLCSFKPRRLGPLLKQLCFGCGPLTIAECLPCTSRHHSTLGLRELRARSLRNMASPSFSRDSSLGFWIYSAPLFSTQP